MPLTSQGYIPRTPQQWYDRIKVGFDSLCTNLGVTPPRWLPHEFVNMIVTLVALSLSEIDEAVGGLHEVRSIMSAGGSYLRELATLVGIVPDNGTSSTVTLTVDAWSTGDVFLPEGTRAQGGGDDGKAVWVTQDDVTIPASGQTTVAAASAEIGTVSAAVNAISTRYDVVAGWTAVDNLSTAILGTDPETDAQIRTNILRGSYGAGSRSPLAIRDAVQRTDGVQKALVVFNGTVSDTIVSTRTVPACGMSIWVWPNTLSTAAQSEVLQTIYGMRDGSAAISYPAASGVDGVTGTIVGADGLEDQVGFWYVLDHVHEVRVTVDTYEPTYSTVAQVSAGIQTAVQDYFDSLFPGDPVRQNDLVGAVAAVAGVARATVEIRKESSAGAGDVASASWSTADSVVDAADRAVLETAATVV